METTIRKTALLGIALAMVAAAAFAHAPQHVIDLVWKYTGGEAAWEKVRYVEFTWQVEKNGKVVAQRHHLWDRHTGDYVVRSKASDSDDEVTTYFNVDSRTGTAVRNGTRVDDKEAVELVEAGYQMFINDTFWLMLPVKLKDYGVRYESPGHDESGDETLLILHLSYEGVGLTPGDQYWIYVTLDGRIARWRYQLEGGHEGEWTWSGEKACGMGITMSTRKTSKDGSTVISTPDAVFRDSMDRSAFAPQSP